MAPVKMLMARSAIWKFVFISLEDDGFLEKGFTPNFGLKGWFTRQRS